MARARTIKQGFFTNDELGSLPTWVRILFAGLWCIADKEGRLLDRPAKIRTDVLPYDKVDVGRGLQMLSEHHFIRRYEVDGVRYIQVQNWAKHQSPHPKEAASEIPPEPRLSNGVTTAEPLPDRGATAAEQRSSNGSATAEPGFARARPGPYVIPSVSSSSVSSSSGPLADARGDADRGDDEDLAHDDEFLAATTVHAPTVSGRKLAAREGRPTSPKLTDTEAALAKWKADAAAAARELAEQDAKR